jgi:hypothetical protein
LKSNLPIWGVLSSVWMLSKYVKLGFMEIWSSIDLVHYYIYSSS